MISVTKVFNKLYGMDIVTVSIGDFSTEIAQWDDNKYFMLSLNTTPKCFVIETGKKFVSVKNAKKYYLERLKICLEDNLMDLKSVNYRRTKK